MVIKLKPSHTGTHWEQSNCGFSAVDALRTATFLFVFIAVPFADHLDAFSFSSPDDPSSSPSRDQVCGRFAFYNFLQFTGRDFTYEEVCDAVPMANRGTSLLELRDAAKKLGVELEIRKTLSTDQSVMQQGPFIAHMRKKRVTEDKFSDLEFDGHFVLVLPPRVWSRPHEIDAIDGSSGMIRPILSRDFPNCGPGTT